MSFACHKKCMPLRSALPSGQPGAIAYSLQDSYSPVEGIYYFLLLNRQEFWANGKHVDEDQGLRVVLVRTGLIVNQACDLSIPRDLLIGGPDGVPQGVWTNDGCKHKLSSVTKLPTDINKEGTKPLIDDIVIGLLEWPGFPIFLHIPFFYITSEYINILE